jgi:hypothetical protein
MIPHKILKAGTLLTHKRTGSIVMLVKDVQINFAHNSDCIFLHAEDTLNFKSLDPNEYYHVTGMLFGLYENSIIY